MNNLKNARTNRPQKLTQKDVADFLGIDRSTYGKYETGDSEPNFETLQKLAKLFDVSIEYLMGATDKEKNPSTDEQDDLSPEEKALLDLIDTFTPEQQAQVLQYARFIDGQAKKDEKK